MKNIGSVLVTGMIVAAAGLGCGGGNKEGAGPAWTGGQGGGSPPGGVTTHVDMPAQKQFSAALDMLNGHDKANDWNDQNCGETARAFEAAASAQASSKFPEGTYDAGLRYQRCGDDKNAKGRFHSA